MGQRNSCKTLIGGEFDHVHRYNVVCVCVCVCVHFICMCTYINAQLLICGYVYLFVGSYGR